MAPARTEAFDALYRASPDPWGTHSRWYERRKRELLLASLPKEHFGLAYEAGCGTGHLTGALAARCDHVLASDASIEAIALAEAATRACPNVTIERHLLPEDWPVRAFDLVVLAELIYFVDAADRTRIAEAARESAGESGLIVACDWRDQIEGHGHRGDEAHARFDAALGLPRRFEYVDADFILSGWSVDIASVAQREGLK